MNTNSGLYCRYCDIATFNSKVPRDGVDPNSHNFKENGEIVCQYYLTNVPAKKTIAKTVMPMPTPVIKPFPVPSETQKNTNTNSKTPRKPTPVPVFHKIAVSKPTFDLDTTCKETISIMRVELDERKREAEIRYSQKFSVMTESEKVRIAKWMKQHTPTGNNIGKEWAPYLQKTVANKK